MKQYSFLALLLFCTLHASDIQLALKGQLAPAHKNDGPADISFAFEKENLTHVIDFFAAKKKINVVLPAGNDAIKNTVTIDIEQKLTLKQAWNILLEILDLAGYVMVQEENLYVVIKNDVGKKNISKEPLQLYINTPFNELPNTSERIRYIHYLTNLKVTTAPDNELKGLIETYLPDERVFRLDKDTNAVLVSGPSKQIRAVFEIIDALDQSEFQERLETIRLTYTDATTVAKLFNDSILATANTSPIQRFRLEGAREEPNTFFSRNVKVIAEPRNNSLLVIGRVQAVERVTEFIYKYIDTQLEEGRSILHKYALQYLDAESFALVLERIVASSSAEGTGQSSAQAGKQSGTERMFENVIIKADTPGAASADAKSGKFYGGNNLLIAARHDDWKRIKRLIEDLDRPQPQVVIEVLIVDLTLDDLRSLGTILRNPADLPFPGNASAQSAMLGSQVILDLPNNGNTSTDLSSSDLKGVNANLNADNVPNSASGAANPFISLPATLQSGSTVLSISDNDGRTWAISDIAQLFNSTQILTHPHVIAINNTKSVITSGQKRLVDDQAAPTSAAVVRRKLPIEANTTVTITPRISNAHIVSLEVLIDINDFSSANQTSSNQNTDSTTQQAANGNRITRNISSNATVKSGDILAIGGLIREAITNTSAKTPLLADIPLFGWLFKQKVKDFIKTTVTVFICPTIIMPKFRAGISDYTKTYVNIAKKNSSQEDLFDTNRDPITRVFFNTLGAGGEHITQAFVDKDEANYVAHTEDEILSLEEREERMLQAVEKQINDAASNTKALMDNKIPEYEHAEYREHVAPSDLAQNNKQTLQELLAHEKNPLLT